MVNIISYKRLTHIYFCVCYTRRLFLQWVKEQQNEMVEQLNEKEEQQNEREEQTNWKGRTIEWNNRVESACINRNLKET